LLAEEHEHLLFANATATLVDDDGVVVVIVVVLANDILMRSKVDKMEKLLSINTFCIAAGFRVCFIYTQHIRIIIKTNVVYRE